MTVIKKAIVKSYDAAAHKATVQIAGSLGVWLDAIRVATDIPAADVQAGRQCTVLFLDPSNQDDAVVITVQGALPSGGGGATTFLALTDTPGSYSGQADKAVQVNNAETALQFGTTWATLHTFSAGIKLAAGQAVKDSGGTDRYAPSTSSPENVLTGDVDIQSGFLAVGNNAAPIATVAANVREDVALGNFGTFWGISTRTRDAGVAGNTAGQIGVEGSVEARRSGGTAGLVKGLSFWATHAATGASTTSLMIGAEGAVGIYSNLGSVTDAEAIRAKIAGSASCVGPTNIRGLKIANTWPWNGGVPVNVFGIDIDSWLFLGTNRYGIKMADIPAGFGVTIARLLDLGPATPYLRLEGSGEWPGALNTSPLSITINNGANVLRRIEVGAANSGGAGYRTLRVLN